MIKKVALSLFCVLVSNLAISKPDPKVIEMYRQNIKDNESGYCYDKVARFELAYYLKQSGANLERFKDVLTEQEFREIAKEWSIKLKEDLIGNESLAIFLAEQVTKEHYHKCLN